MVKSRDYNSDHCVVILYFILCILLYPLLWGQQSTIWNDSHAVTTHQWPDTVHIIPSNFSIIDLRTQSCVVGAELGEGGGF